MVDGGKRLFSGTGNLGIVLGDMLDFIFVTTMIKANEDLLAFFSRPIAAGLGIVPLSI